MVHQELMVGEKSHLLKNLSPKYVNKILYKSVAVVCCGWVESRVAIALE